MASEASRVRGARSLDNPRAPHPSPLPCGERERTRRASLSSTEDEPMHLHVRDNEMLRATLPFTARHFGRAIPMPNPSWDR